MQKKRSGRSWEVRFGEFYGFKSGHALNNQLLKKIESETAYKIIEIDEIKDAPINYLKPVSEELA